MRFILMTTTALILTACGEVPGAVVQNGPMPNSASQGGATATNSLQAYVINAAISDMYERESGKLAVKAANSPQVKVFARTMIADHTATTAEVNKIVSDENLGIALPTQLDSHYQGLLDNLRSAPTADFERIYITQQTAAHREALALHRSYADNGSNAQLKAFAAKAASQVEMHLKVVEKLVAAG